MTKRLRWAGEPRPGDFCELEMPGRPSWLAPICGRLVEFDNETGWAVDLPTLGGDRQRVHVAPVALQLVDYDSLPAAACVLRELFPAGTVARTILRHVSRSGMLRVISVIAPGFNDVTWRVAKVLGWSTDARHSDGLRVGGCGMDMGFHTVYNLSSKLWDDGYAIKQTWI
jgi:hypothetical protein